MIEKRDLYKLPWTKDHNPNGWIEPTTVCQLKCPLCYRGADADGFQGIHMELAEVKRQIDELIRLRRIQTMTIAGGEPLMYPHLDETIDYIRSRDVEVMILTNGLLLDEAMVRRLKAKEVARVVVHIDKRQGRDGVTTEAQANRLREAHCELFRRVGGIALGFIQPLGYADLDDLDVLLPFFKKNADVVDLVAFNRLQPVDFDAMSDEKILQASTLFERFRAVYGMEYAAYLDKTHTDEISWLLGLSVFSGSNYLGSVDKNAFRFFQEDQFRKLGRYVYVSRGPLIRTSKLLMYIPFNRSLRKMSYRYFRSRNGKNGKLHKQFVLLINTPRRLESGELDLCKGCPDAILHGDKLVPSCLLERIKEGEEIHAG